MDQATARSAAAAARDARRAGVRRAVFTIGVFASLVVALTLGLDVWTFILLQMALAATLGGADHLARRRRSGAPPATLPGVLEGLRSRGWRTIDDVALRRGVIDHVLVGPGGVYVLEVSTGEVAEPGQLDELAIRRARRNARTVEELAGRTVVPVLVLDGGRGVVPAVPPHDIVVLPTRVLAGHLRRRPRLLSGREATELTARLRALLERPADAAQHA